jgi:tetratricopeptide (TPR) repeat protein
MAVPNPFQQFLIPVLCLMLAAGCALAPRDDRPKPLTAEQLREMGEHLLASGDAPTAIRYLTEAEEKAPDDPRVQYDLGIAYDAKGLQDEAMRHLREAARLKPDNSEAYNAMGKIYADQGNAAEAALAFQQALANPMYQTPFLPLFNLGLLAEKEGRSDVALTHYQAALKSNPNFAPALTRMGKILEQLGRRDEARASYAAAIQKAPNLAEAYLGYGRLSFQSGDDHNAFLAFQQVIKLAPQTPMAQEAEQYLKRIHMGWPGQ